MSDADHDPRNFELRNHQTVRAPENALRAKQRMHCVSVYERRHHTNPAFCVYVKAWDQPDAVIAAMGFARAHRFMVFGAINVELAEWKVEEEFCSPWQAARLP